jgi:hypothetical protein
VTGTALRARRNPLDTGRADPASYWALSAAWTRAATSAERRRGAAVGEMAASMGFFDKLRSAMSPEKRLLAELAEIAGRSESLADRLKRHGEMCTYPNLKAGVEALAAQEAVHAKALRTIVMDRGAWPRLPDAPGHEGANNWERLGGDLDMLIVLAADLHRAVAGWEPVDEKLTGQLAKIATEDDERESALRQLALKCDPQALD